MEWVRCGAWIRFDRWSKCVEESSISLLPGGSTASGASVSKCYVHVLEAPEAGSVKRDRCRSRPLVSRNCVTDRNMPRRLLERARAQRLADDLHYDPWSRESQSCGRHYHDHRDALGAVDLQRERARLQDSTHGVPEAMASDSVGGPGRRSVRLDAAQIEQAKNIARERRIALLAQHVSPEVTTKAKPAARPGEPRTRRTAEPTIAPSTHVGPSTGRRKGVLTVLHAMPSGEAPRAQRRPEANVARQNVRGMLAAAAPSHSRLPSLQPPDPPAEPTQPPSFANAPRAVHQRIAQQRVALGLHADATTSERITRQREGQIEAAATVARAEAQRQVQASVPAWWPRATIQPQAGPSAYRAIAPPREMMRPPSAGTVAAAQRRLREVWMKMEAEEELSAEEVSDVKAILELKKIWKQREEQAVGAADEAGVRRAHQSAAQAQQGRPIRANGHEVASLIGGGWGT